MALPRAGLTPRAKVLLPLFLVTLLLLSYFRLRPAEDTGTQSFGGKTMGTTYSVVLGQGAPETEAALAKALQAELDRVEALMSTYREDSELSRFNASRSTEAFEVSEDTAQVVAAALQLSAESGGAFDVTVRPLVALWGFGAGAKAKPPSDAEIERAKARVGFAKLRVSEQPPSLTKTDPELSCDLSAIAKGYGVDRLAALLEARGIEDYLVEVGGEMRAAGQKAPGEKWRVGIERPDSETRAVSAVIGIGDTGMATSGDYRNYYEKDGVRISHTIDARTGKPITHTLASVSVLHPEAMRADGYATALNVLGPEEGLALARRLKLAAAFIVRGDDASFETITTPEFDAAVELMDTSTK